MLPHYNMVVVDGDDLLRRSDAKFGKLSTTRGQWSGALFGSVRSLFKILKDHHPWYCSVLFDENPPQTSRDLHDQRAALREFLTLLGIQNKTREVTDLPRYLDIAGELNSFTILVISDEWPMADHVTDRVHWMYDKNIEAHGAVPLMRGHDVPLDDCLIKIEKSIPEKLTSVRDFLSHWEMKTVAQQLKIAM